MNASITTCEEFFALREVRGREKKMKRLGLTSPENRTEEEEMDMFATIMEYIAESPKKYPGAVVAQFTIKQETLENPIAGVLCCVAEDSGYYIEATLFGRTATITIRKSYRTKKEEDGDG